MNIFERILEDPRRFRIVKRIFYISLFLVVLFDSSVHLHILPGHTAEHFFGDKIWGFWALFGFIGCVLMIKICKGVAHAFLMKKEDYYN